MRKTLMECSLHFLMSYITAPNATPSTAAQALKMVRLAGFRGHPVVPDRTAFGAATEREADRYDAQKQCPSPEHGPPAPQVPSIRPQAGHFQAMPPRCSLPPDALYPTGQTGRGTACRANDRPQKSTSRSA